LSTSHTRYFFDHKRGLVQRAEIDSSQGNGFKAKRTGRTRLRDVKEHDAAWLKQFSGETETYFAAADQYRERTEQAEKDAGKAKALLARAEKSIKDVRAKLSLPILREQIDDLLKSHEQMAKYIVESAARRAAMLGKPAADWKTSDLAGKEHSLKGYRGK